MPHQQYRTTLCSIFSLTLTYIQVLTSTHTLTHTHTHACTHTLCICHYIYSVHDDWNKGKAEMCTPNTPPSHKACLTMEMRKEKNVRPPCLPERRYKSIRQNPCWEGTSMSAYLVPLSSYVSFYGSGIIKNKWPSYDFCSCTPLHFSLLIKNISIKQIIFNTHSVTSIT